MSVTTPSSNVRLSVDIPKELHAEIVRYCREHGLASVATGTRSLLGHGLEAWPTPRDPAAATIFHGRTRLTTE
jgi:hypothetical protein